MHSTEHYGLQEHSIGELYPWTIAGRGCNPVRWQAVNLLTGETGPTRDVYDDAENDAYLRLMNWETIRP